MNLYIMNVTSSYVGVGSATTLSHITTPSLGGHLFQPFCIDLLQFANIHLSNSTAKACGGEESKNMFTTFVFNCF